jgi:hypothetical protein
MSKFVPVEGISKRPKRASRACDHCRWKRVSCSPYPGNRRIIRVPVPVSHPLKSSLNALMSKKENLV